MNKGKFYGFEWSYWKHQGKERWIEKDTRRFFTSIEARDRYIDRMRKKPEFIALLRLFTE